MNEKQKSIAIAFLVTMIWASSWVLIRIGLADIPPVTFAGSRYFLAFLILLPFALRKYYRQELKKLSKKDWTNLVWLGLLYYTITQGSLFASLALLPATAVSLILSFTSIITALFAARTLYEKNTWLQWVGIMLNIIGVYLYFFPVMIADAQLTGILVAVLGMLANSFSTVLGRKINRSNQIPSILVTTISMGIGSIFLLVIGIISEGLPSFSIQNLILLLGMAILNTAIAFTLWNKALQGLEAVEASIINNTLVIQIAVVAWIFLDEKLSILDWVGIGVVAVGAVIVQLRPSRQSII